MTIGVTVTQLDSPPPQPAAVATGIVAQPAGASLPAVTNIVTGISLNTFVVLTILPGQEQTVFNRSGAGMVLNVQAPAGTVFWSLAAGASWPIPDGSGCKFVYDGALYWHALIATGTPGSAGPAGPAGPVINSGTISGGSLSLVRSDGATISVAGTLSGPGGTSINSGTVSGGSLSLVRSDGSTIAVAGTLTGPAGPAGTVAANYAAGLAAASTVAPSVNLLITQGGTDRVAPLSDVVAANAVSLATMNAGSVVATTLFAVSNDGGSTYAKVSGTQIAAYVGGGILSAGTVTTTGTIDFVPIVHAGTVELITWGNWFAAFGQNITGLSAGVGITDTTKFSANDGAANDVAYTLANVKGYIFGALPSYEAVPVEISTAGTVTLDHSTHNGRVVWVTSAGVTIAPPATFANAGSGFSTEVINLSGTTVALAAGIISSTGTLSIPAGISAHFDAATLTTGNKMFVTLPGSAVTAPGAPGVPAQGATTSSTIALTWAAPSTGGAVSNYLVQTSPTGAGTWTTFGTQPATAAVTLTGLTASTGYDIRVSASNAGGTSGYSPVLVNAVTSAGLAAPGQVTGLTAGTPTAATVPLTWAAPSTGGAVATYTINFRVTGAGSWATASSGTVSGLSYTVAGLSSATAYDFQVIAVNATGSGTPSSTANATTAAGPPTYTLALSGAGSFTNGGVAPYAGNQYAILPNTGIYFTLTASSGNVTTHNPGLAQIGTSAALPTGVAYNMSASNSTPPADATSGTPARNNSGSNAAGFGGAASWVSMSIYNDATQPGLWQVNHAGIWGGPQTLAAIYMWCQTADRLAAGLSPFLVSGLTMSTTA